ncbi:hypothetical protein A2Y83_05560 [Candidatus Falkowbacteria bacterium RBG_13_39_14]|uniref:Class II aldolase/adducin N-terminal domain-containing protein n=1 Tax=Candidatus Falkowbacteria bacterium RBG_13_39_14 TaxID=1797985 RepID=A0A1F5S7I1_9BACT|nr:MAG: hypothetical protein A2Y83_05560 [Candidatus Falkowbacteria bacterium RBG_13_39_14]
MVSNNKVIKFNAIQSLPYIDLAIDLSQFVCCRKNLQNKKLIGRIEAGEFAGYDCGNISLRLRNGNGNHNFRFVISGSQTSSKREFNSSDVALIEEYDSGSFSVKYSGTAIPSSETPLHGSSYKADPRIGAIIHAHIFESSPFYEQCQSFFLRHGLPLTYCPSKTAEIGEEIISLIREKGHGDIIGMLNHDGGFGLLSFGENLKIAYSKLLTLHSQFKKL